MTFQKTFVGSAFAAALLLGATLPLTGAHAVTINNGSFENGSYTDGGSGFMTLNAGAPNLAGWTISSGSIDWINTYWQAADGSYSLDMSGNGAGAISQTLTGLTIGQTYNVSFDLAGNPDGNPPTKQLTTAIVGIGSQNYSFTVTGSDSHTNMGWTSESFAFTATGTSALLSFASDVSSPYGPALDNVSITATPLPATWIMMLGGLLGFGGLAYRRRGIHAPALTAA